MIGFVVTYGAVLSQVINQRDVANQDLLLVLQWMKNASTSWCVNSCQAAGLYPSTATTLGRELY